MQHHKKQGFTLIEVLISLLILAVSFIGFTSLQGTLLKLNNDSYYRAVATTLGRNMVERMLANTPAISSGSYNNAAGSSSDNSSCLGLSTSGSNDNSSCTAAEIAAHDFYEWDALLAGSSATAWAPAVTAMLPNASGVVCIDSTPDDGVPGTPACDNSTPAGSPTIYAVKIWWFERSDSSVHQHIETFQPSA